MCIVASHGRLFVNERFVSMMENIFRVVAFEVTLGVPYILSLSESPPPAASPSSSLLVAPRTESVAASGPSRLISVDDYVFLHFARRRYKVAALKFK